MRTLTLLLLSFISSQLFSQTVRVATYNVQNYLSCDRSINGAFLPSYPKPEKEKEALRKVVKAVNPDILCLQEIGQEAYLKEFQEDLKQEGAVYPYRYIYPAPGKEKRHLAVLSRFPALESQLKTDFAFKHDGQVHSVKRGLLELAFKIKDQSLFHLYNLHLKSQWRVKGVNVNQVRIGEATAIRDYIFNANSKEKRYVVMGDFNDNPKTTTVKRFLEKNKQKIGKRVPSRDSRGETWTYNSSAYESYTTFDHIILSPELYALNESNVGVIFDEKSGDQASDHRLVYVDLNL